MRSSDRSISDYWNGLRLFWRAQFGWGFFAHLDLVYQRLIYRADRGLAGASGRPVAGPHLVDPAFVYVAPLRRRPDPAHRHLDPGASIAMALPVAILAFVP
jgi:hypothetical protein